MTITDSPVEKCILNSDIKKEVLYQTGKTMEPFFEVIQKLDMMAADAVNIALDAERMANATSKLEVSILSLSIAIDSLPNSTSMPSAVA